MTTNWQDPHAAVPPPPQAPTNNPKKRFALVAVLLVVIAGLAAAAGLVMANRSDDGGQVADDAQYVVMDTPSTTPVFEPAFAAGDDPFYPLSDQLIAYQAEAEEEIAEQVAIAVAEAEPGEDVIVPVFNVAELEENVKTGLYGGTEENTCDPERLISFLIAHPKIGEAWAQVQGIEFSEIPEYIRGLQVRVLAADLAVQNHGFDQTTQSAYAIDSVLAAGTAVLVDENGDVRTRCYCGNPIVPKPPVNYMPPRCIIWGASVFTVPGGTTRRDNAPTDVLLTGQQAIRPDGAVWVEVKWGNNDDQKGWVRHDWVRNHYCPPPTWDYECPGPDEVPVYGNDKTTVVGFVTGTLNLHDGPTEIYAPIEPVSTVPGDVTIEDGFLLIHFTRVGPSNSGWVNTADLNQDDENCHHIIQCVEITQNVLSRPGGADLGPGYSGKMRVAYTGKFAPANRAFTEIRLLDFGSQVGWIAPLFVTNLADAECDDKPLNNCVQTAVVYENSAGADRVGELNNAEVIILSAVPQDGRININMAPGGPEGWVDEGNFMGGWNSCAPVPECYYTDGPAYTIFETDGAMIPADPTPRLIDLVGKKADDPAGVDDYERIEEGAVRYWIRDSDLVPLLPEQCEIDAECPTPYDEYSDELDSVSIYDGPLRFTKVQNQDPDVDRQPGDEGGETPTNDCCVTALFASPNVGDPSATSVPRVVTVIGADNIDPDLAWFTTSDSDYFQRIHLAPAGDGACMPECPDYGDDDGGDGQGDPDLTITEQRDTLGGGDMWNLVTVVEPELPMKQGKPGGDPGDQPVDGCCVTELHAGVNTGNTIVVPEFVNVEAGPIGGPGGDWFRTDTGEHFPAGAVTNPADCNRDIDCPTGNVYDDELGKLSDPRLDISSLTSASTEPYVVSLFLNINACCVDGGSLLYSAPGVDTGVATTEPRLAALEDVTVDGVYAEAFFFDDFSVSWVETADLVPLSECLEEEPECPRESVKWDDAKNALCCVQNEDGDFELIDLSEIDEDTNFADEGRCVADSNPCPKGSQKSVDFTSGDDVGVEAGCCVSLASGLIEVVPVDQVTDDMTPVSTDLCNRLAECPTPKGVTPPEPTFSDVVVCCVEINGEYREAIMTGKRRDEGGGVIGYQAEGDVWYVAEDFRPNGLCEIEKALPPAPQPTTVPRPTATPVPPVVQAPCANQGGDTDGDTICDAQDNCDNDRNRDQADSDQDGIGDVCDTREAPCLYQGGDSDGDGACDDYDNCLTVVNPKQADTNSNGVGDLCERSCPDLDQDEVCDDDDVCKGVYNPGNTYPYPNNQCEAGETTPTTPTTPTCELGDRDKDDVCDDIDKCPGFYNPGNTTPCSAPCPDRDGDTFCDKPDKCPDRFSYENVYPYPDNPYNKCEPPPALGGSGAGTGTSGGTAGTGTLAPGSLLPLPPGTFTPTIDLDLDDDPLI